MAREMVPTNKIKRALMPALLVLLISGMVFCNLVWMKAYLYRSIKYIGVFSQYLTKEELIDCINKALGPNNREIIKEGIEALDMSGYSNSHAILIIGEAGLMSMAASILFISMGVLLIIIHKNNKNRYLSQITNLFMWTKGKQIEAESYSELPNEMIEAVFDLKYRLERMSEIHEEDNKRLISYLEDISHQLKTPLAVIRVICEKDMERNIISATDMNKCIDQIDKMSELIRELLVLGRLECKKVNAQFKEISPHNIMDSIVNDYEFLCQKAGVALEVKGVSDDKWLCDEFWIRQAIDNVLFNALKHSESGGKITIEYYSNSTENCILIWDDGAGFENGSEKTIFNRFSSKDRLGKEGFGLGLAITHQIIELHFGTIIARNHEPKGAEFYITLPKLDSDTIYNMSKEMSHCCKVDFVN